MVWLWWSLTRLAALGLGLWTARADRGDVFRDIEYYAAWAQQALDGSRIPYLDFGWEYPPAALPVMLPAELLTGWIDGYGFGPYSLAWVALALLADASVFAMVLRRVDDRSLGHPAVAVWALGPPLLGAVSWARFDLYPAVAAFVVVLAAAAGRQRASGLAAGVGAALKLWPGMLAPVQRTRRAAVTATALAVGVLAGVAAVTFVATGSTGFAQVVQYQRARGLQIESVAALPLLWLRQLGGDGYEPQFAFGAWELTGPGAAAMATLATVAFVAVLAAVGLRHWQAMRVDAGPAGVGLTAVMILLASLLTNKVFSPQYLLWLLAVIAAAAVLDPEDWRGITIPLLLTAATTHLVFPQWYGDVIYGGWMGLLAITVRDLLLIAVAVVVTRRWWRRTSAAARIST